MSQTILFIEDLLTCREPIAVALRKSGYRVFCAETARAALNLIDDHCPDLILMDLALPDMSGQEFLQALRQLPHFQHIPAIVFSGSGNVMHLLGGLGVYCCLVKSVDAVTEIKAAIAKALGEEKGKD